MVDLTVPFHRPDIDWKEEREVVRVLQSGWLTQGPEVERLEAEVEGLLGPGVHVVACASATAAFEMLWSSPPLRSAAGAIFPTWTYSSPAMAAYRAGKSISLVDVDRNLLMHPHWFLGGATVIVPTHFAGNAVSIELETAAGIVVEDAAHCAPGLSTYPEGGLVGASTRSLATVFSLYATKCMTAAEGGLIATRDEELAQWLRRARINGMSSAAYGAGPSRPDYEVVQEGWKANLSDVHAAIARVQLARGEEMLLRRRWIHSRYQEALSDVVWMLPHQPGSSYHLCVVRHPRRNALRVRLAAEGIGTSVHFKPLHNHSWWDCETGRAAFCRPMDVADPIGEEVFSLPLYSSMTDAQVDHVIESVCAALREAGATHSVI